MQPEGAGEGVAACRRVSWSPGTDTSDTCACEPGRLWTEETLLVRSVVRERYIEMSCFYGVPTLEKLHKCACSPGSLA